MSIATNYTHCHGLAARCGPKTDSTAGKFHAGTLSCTCSISAPRPIVNDKASWPE